MSEIMQAPGEVPRVSALVSEIMKGHFVQEDPRVIVFRVGSFVAVIAGIDGRYRYYLVL